MENLPLRNAGCSRPSLIDSRLHPLLLLRSGELSYGRAEWGADESLVGAPPSYLDEVDAVFVHHTAGTNAYDCADSPAVIRAILTYHVKANGWNDIGYNFFVDKCGTVFEGRAGGADKPVRGAHTYGFNGYSAGVALLGDHENGGTPGTAARRAVPHGCGRLTLHHPIGRHAPCGPAASSSLREEDAAEPHPLQQACRASST
ncbi:hypothetical protein GCM10010330_51830 [Streptomyces tendae]|uniref:N-acetylmuramoyl-L-alanine amidase n=1 Tax=Streptomyces tendae TaxID=1932 RepID=UPI0019CE7E8D|nr:hypothetical protein GCM10010330_51830 [Streptomyces tendae]